MWRESYGPGTMYASYCYYSLWWIRSSDAYGFACTNMRSRPGCNERPSSGCWHVGCEGAARERDVGRTTVSAHSRLGIGWHYRTDWIYGHGIGRWNTRDLRDISGWHW